MTVVASAGGAVARHPVAAFLLIGNGLYLAAALTPPLVDAEVLPFKLPLFASLGTILGVGVAAFLDTAATGGRVAVGDLVRRSVRWRPRGGRGRRRSSRPSSLSSSSSSSQEIGWTGFLQHRLQDRYATIKVSALVALPWAVWHLPDFFAEEDFPCGTSPASHSKRSRSATDDPQQVRRTGQQSTRA
jgi:hypothetical protein